MMIVLFMILAATVLLPLFIKKVGENLEPFLFVMGILAAAVSGALTSKNIEEIFANHFLYIITGAVFIVSIVFRVTENKMGDFVNFASDHVPIKILSFLIVVILGLLSSVITAIIAALVLTEFVSLLPLKRKGKVRLCISGCFSIGLGAALTPVGEPLSTIVVSKMHGGMDYMFKMVGPDCIAAILLIGLLAAFSAGPLKKGPEDVIYIPEKETPSVIAARTVKIFVFVVGLDLLGLGFKPVIDTYVIHWSDSLLYAANVMSAVLDNATLAAAEISPEMTILQVRTILMSLLISGGMLVTGNIPNIVTAGKLKISMKEWARFAVPVGAVLLIGFYVVLFIV